MNEDDFKNLYDVLGVSESATSVEIRKRFRTLSKLYHTDKLSGEARDPEVVKEATERFIEARDTYEILIDPKKRAQYDELLEEYRKNRTQTSASGGSYQPPPLNPLLVQHLRPQGLHQAQQPARQRARQVPKSCSHGLLSAFGRWARCSRQSL